MEKKPSKYKIQKQEIPEFDLSPEVERLQKQLDRDPNSKVFLPLAEEYRRSKMPEEAIFILEEGIKRNPAYSAAKIALARAYLEINEIMKAKQAIDDILIKMPHHPLAMKLHGDISFREGDFLEARKAYEIVKQLNPMDLEVNNKLSELQVSVSGSKIEVASISEHEADIQIERSYDEHKAPPQTTIPSDENNNVIGELQEESQTPGFSVPPPSVPQRYQEPDQSALAGYVQLPSVAGSDMYATDNRFSEATIPQFADNAPLAPMDIQSESASQDLDYNKQAHTQQQFQSDQFQGQDLSAGLPETVNYAQEYIPPDSQVMEGVPLVSHEVVMPDRYTSHQRPFSYPENQEKAESSPDFQQNQNYQSSNQPDISADDIFKVSTDSGGFYTGPPTDPYVDQYDKVYSEGQAEIGNPLAHEFQPDSQNNAGYELPQLANTIIQEAAHDSSFDGFVQEQIVQPHEDFKLDELEAEINIPMPGKIEMNGDLQQQQVMQKQQSLSAAGEERINIDSLEINELNVEEMAKKFGIQEAPLITTPDIASEISSQYSELTGNVLEDNIFKQPQTSQIPADAGIQNKQSDEKYNIDLAELYTKQGHFDKALDIYKKLLESQPDNQEIINRLIDTEKKKNSAQNVESTNVSPTERIAKMEEWFRTLLKNKKESGS